MTGPANILLILFDSLGERDYLRSAAALPHLSALRSTSVVFANAHTPCPEGGPARASLFTGLDMAAHGVWTDGVALPDHEVTVPERFASVGYATWLVGRRHLAGVSHWTTEHPRPYEYTHFDWAHGPLHRSRQNAYLEWLQNTAPDHYAALFPHQANPDEKCIPDTQRAAMRALPDALSYNHWVGQQVIKRATEIGPDQPFLGIAGLVVGDTMGVPRGAGPNLEGINDKALAQADRAIGAMLKAVDTIPNLTVVVTSTRGSLAPGDPRPMQSGSLHVPLSIRSPGEPASRNDGIVSTMDLAPTLYEIAKVPPLPRMQGCGLLSENPRGWAIARIRHPDSPPQTALTQGRWKLVVTHGAGPASEQLYDLAVDPDETSDLASDPAYRDRLDRLVDQMIDTRVALEDRTEPRVALF